MSKYYMPKGGLRGTLIETIMITDNYLTVNILIMLTAAAI